MDATILYHQSVQMRKIAPLSLTTVSDGNLWTSTCNHNGKKYTASDKVKKQAINSLYAQVLESADIVQKPSGKDSKRLFLDSGGVYTVNACCNAEGLYATITLKHKGKTHAYNQLFDSIGSMDRFIKSSCTQFI
jgi:hypothetical protein